LVGFFFLGIVSMELRLNTLGTLHGVHNGGKVYQEGMWSRDKSAIPGLLHCGLSCPSPRTGHAPLSASSSPSDTALCTLCEESEGSLLLGDLQAVHTSALPLSSLRTT